jgi:hypothetical protein
MSEKNNLNTKSKYILEKIFQKYIKFWKTFSKNYKSKIGILRGSEETFGGRR